MEPVIAYYYDAALNPNGEYIVGVPLRDLTTEDIAALSPYLADGVAGCPFYHAAQQSAPELPAPPRKKAQE